MFARTALLTVLLASISTSMAAGQDDARARAGAAFEQGVGAFDEGRYQEALEAFQEAYRLAPHPSVRVNMANCYEKLERPVEAIDHFERYLLEAGDLPPARRREIEETLARLRGQVGELFFRVEPAGATVTIDGRTSLEAPILDAVRLPQGPHQVSVQANGRIEQREVTVRGGERDELQVSVTDASPRDPAFPIEASPLVEALPDEPPPRRRNVGAIVVGSTTGAIGAGALATGLLALGAQKDFDDAVERSNDPNLAASEREAARQDGLNAKDRADRFALISDILMGAAIVGAGVTLTLLILGPPEPDDDEAPVTASAVVLPQGGAVVLDGRF